MSIFIVDSEPANYSFGIDYRGHRTLSLQDLEIIDELMCAGLAEHYCPKLAEQTLMRIRIMRLECEAQDVIRASEHFSNLEDVNSSVKRYQEQRLLQLAKQEEKAQ